MPTTAADIRVSSTSPITDIVSVTPSDSADLPNGVARGFYFEGAGAIKVTTLAGTAVTLSGLAASTFYPVAVSRIWSTGTTATTIRALY